MSPTGSEGDPGSFELRPNKRCPRCGEENVASLDRCLACGAAFRGAVRPSAIVTAKDAKGMAKPSAPGRSAASKPLPWQNRFHRSLGIAAIVVLIFLRLRGPVLAGMVALVVVPVLGLFARAVESGDRDGASRDGGVKPPVFVHVLDLALCSIGGLASLTLMLAVAPVVLIIGLIVAFTGVCTVQ